jgi:hypothetical protein
MGFIIDRSKVSERLKGLSITDASSCYIEGSMFYDGDFGVLRIAVHPLYADLIITFNDQPLKDFDHYKMIIDIMDSVTHHTDGFTIEHIPFEGFKRHGFEVLSCSDSEDQLSAVVTLQDNSTFDISVNSCGEPVISFNGKNLEFSAFPWLLRCFQTVD